MILEQWAYVGEIAAAIAVVGSLIFVAMEVRKNTDQAKMANYGSIVERINAINSQTGDIDLANLVAKGRESYHDLSEGEKISYGHYLEGLCIAHESVLVLANQQVHDRDRLLELHRKQMRFHVGFPGAREWFEEYEGERGFPPILSASIREAIGWEG